MKLSISYQQDNNFEEIFNRDARRNIYEQTLDYKAGT